MHTLPAVPRYTHTPNSHSLQCTSPPPHLTTTSPTPYYTPPAPHHTPAAPHYPPLLLPPVSFPRRKPLLHLAVVGGPEHLRTWQMQSCSTHVRTYTRTYVCNYVHVQYYTVPPPQYTHTNRHTHTRTYVHPHTNAHTHTHHTHTPHTNTHTTHTPHTHHTHSTHTHTHICTHTQTHTRTHTQTHVRAHAHTHAHSLTHAHTHTPDVCLCHVILRQLNMDAPLQSHITQNTTNKRSHTRTLSKASCEAEGTIGLSNRWSSHQKRCTTNVRTIPIDGLTAQYYTNHIQCTRTAKEHDA